MKEIITAQRRFFNCGVTRSVSFRKKMLTKLEEGLLRREKELLGALKSDLNKTAFEGYETELGIVLAELRYARKHLDQWAKPKSVPMPIAQFPAKGYIFPEPYGVALIMSPWNYPVQLTLVPLVSALAAGCTAVVKPSAYAPATSAALSALLGEIFQPEYVAVVEGGRRENAALLEGHFDYIFFTGSPEVGKTVMTAAARHLTPVTLELGGESPVIVAPDADLDLTAKRLVWGKFLNAGQTCVAPDHVWVTPDQREALVAAMEKYIGKFYGERPLEGTDLPRIVNRKHYDRLCALLGSGVTAVGGQTDPEALRIAPTVLVDVTEEDPVMGEEIFGPILPVLTYETLDELIAHLQEKPRPLALYLFTRSGKVEKKVVGSLVYGGGCVNDAVVHLAVSGLPFGGVGNSGMGSCHGKAGFDTFTHRKSILRKGCLDVPVRYPPYKEKRIGILKKLM